LIARATDVVDYALRHGGGFADAESLLVLRKAHVANEAERQELQAAAWIYYVVRGQPRRALTWLQDRNDPANRAAIIIDALFGDADSLEAARLVKEVSLNYGEVSAGSAWQSVVEMYAGAQHHLAHGRLSPARRAVRAWSGQWTPHPTSYKLRFPQDTSQVLRLASHLALLLDAQLTAMTSRSNARTRLAQLDSVLQTAPTYGSYLISEGTFGGFELVGNVVAARLWHARGETPRALAAIRRGRIEGWPGAVLATQLREEGRYAALTGDLKAAVLAYRHYLALRNEAEPSLRAQVQAVQAEYTALMSVPEQD
jgi:hypothetical protein